MKELNGFIVLNKEKGMTSNRALMKLRGILRGKGYVINKIGHLGTLDPDGEGVLPIAVGKATKLFDFLLDKRKTYYTEFTFGYSTDTLDTSGVEIERCDLIPSSEEILSAIPNIIGEISQMPPAYSAKSVNGVRAYKLARNGVQPELTPKTVTIYSIKLLEKLEQDTYAFEIETSGGTYIRSIARDLATELNTLGVMRYIKRTKSGDFHIENALTLSELNDTAVENVIISPEKCLSQLNKYKLPSVGADKLALNGVEIEFLKNLPENNFALYLSDGTLAGIAIKNEKGGLRIITRLI